MDHEPAGKPRPSDRQITERLIAEIAFTAPRADVHRRRVRELAGRPEVAAVFSAMLVSEVATVWRRGWQPAELVRAVRREVDEDCARLVRDTVAEEARGYAAARLDDRWRAQLKDIGADSGPEGGPFGGQRGDAEAVLSRALSVLTYLRRLPELPFAGPLPGEARPESPARARGPVDQRMLDRVRALLAKAESTTFPQEAEAYTAKAQELMARHSIDLALLAARTGGRDEPAVRRVLVDNPYEASKTMLLQVVASANNCRAVWSRNYGFSTVMGFPADLDSVELLFTSLLVQAIKAMTQTGPHQDRYGRNNTRSFRQAFLTAYAHRIGERLSGAAEDAVREAQTETTMDLLPVLKARADQVQERFTALFPRLETQTVTVRNAEGWAQGRAAADRADLHGRSAVQR
ncbi:DUF2786 domain-containing protein [Hamadaea tsunoensis]|uniref:DUF2786 domain-containing protein n=1 Tax=Hamadaea tsunoensis TaxID=53368 RepID=UPI000404D039|nr:DUF2786 domain-containing protein [Hamadaea tsunoensis]